VRSLAAVVDEALAKVGGDGVTGVVDWSRLARSLAHGRAVVAIAREAPRTGWLSFRARDGAVAQVRGAPDALPFAPGELAALVARIEHGEDRRAPLAEWSRVVSDGGVVVLIHRDRAAEVAGRLLCTRLVDIEQRRAGGMLVSFARVRRLEPLSPAF